MGGRFGATGAAAGRVRTSSGCADTSQALRCQASCRSAHLVVVASRALAHELLNTARRSRARVAHDTECVCTAATRRFPPRRTAQVTALHRGARERAACDSSQRRRQRHACSQLWHARWRRALLRHAALPPAGRGSERTRCGARRAARTSHTPPTLALSTMPIYSFRSPAWVSSICSLCRNVSPDRQHVLAALRRAAAAWKTAARRAAEQG